MGRIWRRGGPGEDRRQLSEVSRQGEPQVHRSALDRQWKVGSRLGLAESY